MSLFDLRINIHVFSPSIILCHGGDKYFLDVFHFCPQYFFSNHWYPFSKFWWWRLASSQESKEYFQTTGLMVLQVAVKFSCWMLKGRTWPVMPLGETIMCAHLQPTTNKLSTVGGHLSQYQTCQDVEKEKKVGHNLWILCQRKKSSNGTRVLSS